MSSLKRWHQVGGGGTLHKWTEPGDVLEGVWKGITPGKYGDLGVLEVAGQGRITFPIHTALADKVKQLKPDAEVQIMYNGKRESKSGTEYKDFTVCVADPCMLEGGEDVPF